MFVSDLPSENKYPKKTCQKSNCAGHSVTKGRQHSCNMRKVGKTKIRC